MSPLVENGEANPPANDGMKLHDTGPQRPTLRREANGVWRMVERAAATETPRPQPATPDDPREGIATRAA